MDTYTNKSAQAQLHHQPDGSSVEQVHAQAVFSVTTCWLGGLKSETVCKSSTVDGQTLSGTGHRLFSDEPEQLGGGGSAPNPQELLLAAFNACLTASYVTAARAENVYIDRLNIVTSGGIDVSRFLGLETSGTPEQEILRYVINVSGSGTVSQFEKIHQSVIATSPNRWIIGKGMLIEGDQVIT